MNFMNCTRAKYTHVKTIRRAVVLNMRTALTERISIGGRVFRKTSIYVISGRHQYTSCPSDKMFLKGVAVVLNMRTALTERLQVCIAAIV